MKCLTGQWRGLERRSMNTRAERAPVEQSLQAHPGVEGGWLSAEQGLLSQAGGGRLTPKAGSEGQSGEGSV